MPDNELFQNIDKRSDIEVIPRPDKINDIDIHGTIYDNIIDASESHTLDLTSINSFTNISQSRDEVYHMLDIMSEDPTISVALSIYASDACEPNDAGKVVWAESDDKDVLYTVNHILDQMNVDKNSYKWVHSLVKYGDLYLRLYRNSEYNKDLFAELREEQPEKLNEDVKIKAYAPDDHYAEYMEMHKNPAEIFDLQKFGKTVGYVRSHVVSRAPNQNDIVGNFNNINNGLFQYNFHRGDIDIFPATDFVHGCLEDNSSRTSEEVSITTELSANPDDKLTYTVKRGQSLLYNSFRIWRELSLLENSVMLNRLTKSSIIRTVSVEVGDMEKSDVRTLLARIKGMIEQKSAINVNKSYEDYTNPGPVENIIYVPTHDGKGAITPGEIGGQVNVGDLTDLDYFKNKMYGSLGIPKQFLGDTDDAAGFSGGESLSLISSRYAKTVKMIQNVYIQVITDAVNLILLDKGLAKYINTFAIKMQPPTTQEEKNRKDTLSSSISNIREIMSLVSDNGIENPKSKLDILKTLLANAINDESVITILQEEIEKLEESGELDNVGESGEGGFDDFGGGGDFGGGAEPMEFTPDELGGEEPVEEPEAEVAEEPEAPEESFLTGTGELLNEANNLPSFADMGMSYTDVRP